MHTHQQTAFVFTVVLRWMDGVTWWACRRATLPLGVRGAACTERHACDFFSLCYAFDASHGVLAVRWSTPESDNNGIRCYDSTKWQMLNLLLWDECTRPTTEALRAKRRAVCVCGCELRKWVMALRAAAPRALSHLLHRCRAFLIACRSALHRAPTSHTSTDISVFFFLKLVFVFTTFRFSSFY